MAAAPRANLSRAPLTAGMLTRTVLAVAVRAIDTAEKANPVGSFTMAAVPRPCALPPCARPRAAGSLTLSAVTVVMRCGAHMGGWGGGGRSASNNGGVLGFRLADGRVTLRKTRGKRRAGGRAGG